MHTFALVYEMAKRENDPITSSWFLELGVQAKDGLYVYYSKALQDMEILTRHAQTILECDALLKQHPTYDNNLFIKLGL